jgi:allantoinase
MWDRLAKGLVEYVSTDHAPWPITRKTDPDIFKCGAGLTGLQSFAPLMFTLLARRGLPPTVMAQVCAERTARFHGLYPRKGAIRVGSDADFCVIAPGRNSFDEATIQDRPECRWSPYHGMEMAGRVVASLLRGTLIYGDGTVHAVPGQGRFVKRAA